MTWQQALADCKGTYIVRGPIVAQKLASDYLRVGTITVQDFIALTRWTEGRPSYAARLWA